MVSSSLSTAASVQSSKSCFGDVKGRKGKLLSLGWLISVCPAALSTAGYIGKGRSACCRHLSEVGICQCCPTYDGHFPKAAICLQSLICGGHLSEADICLRFSMCHGDLTQVAVCLRLLMCGGHEVAVCLRQWPFS